MRPLFEVSGLKSPRRQPYSTLRDGLLNRELFFSIDEPGMWWIASLAEDPLFRDCPRCIIMASVQQSLCRRTGDLNVKTKRKIRARHRHRDIKHQVGTGFHPWGDRRYGIGEKSACSSCRWWSRAVYGMAATLPVRSVVEELLERYIDLLYKV